MICSALLILVIQFFTMPATVSFAQNQCNPSEAQKYNLTGMEYLEKKEYVNAHLSFQKAVYFNPSVKFYHNNIAVACMNLKKYEEAIAHLQKAIAIDPSYAKALSNMAVCYFHLSQYRLAFTYYRKARNANSVYTDNRFTQSKIIREMEQVHKSRPQDTELQQIIEHVRKLEKTP